MLIVNKILVFFIVFASLIVIRDTLSFISRILVGNDNETFTTSRLIIFGISLSYIMTIIITGLKVIE